MYTETAVNNIVYYPFKHHFNINIIVCMFIAHSLEKDLEELLLVTGRAFCDINLQLDGVTISAHKVILAARCGYFEAMFRSFMPDSKTVTVCFVRLIDIGACDAKCIIEVFDERSSKICRHNRSLFIAAIFLLLSEAGSPKTCEFCTREQHFWDLNTTRLSQLFPWIYFGRTCICMC